MNKLSILSFLMIAFLFAQCSKKTTDKVMTKTVEVKEVKDPKLAWRSEAPSPAPAKPVQLGDYKSFELNNGLKVIVVENHKLPRVSYQLSLKNDPIIEGDQAGYVSMAGDLMATGTKTRSKADIDAAVDFIGANLNTSSSGMFASSLKKHGDKLLDIMTDVLYNPTFPEDEFEKLKKQTLSGIESNKTDPNSMAANVASVLNYGKDHPYGEIETDETVANISLDKAKGYYNTYFKPNNAYLIIVGDIDQAEAKSKAEKYFGNWKKGTLPEAKYETPDSPEGAKVAIANKDGAVQSVIRITYPIDLKPGADDLVKARVMNSILGGGIFSGRLMQNLREDKAYTYGARSQVSSDDLVGNFNAFASVRNAVTDSSVTEFLFEMNRLRDEPVSADDLSLVKSSMTGGFARSLESPQTIARFALNTFKYNLPKDYYTTYLQRLDAVSIADVQAMAKKYIRPDNANIVIVGSKDDIADKLVKFDTDGVLDYYDSFGNKLEMNDIAIPAGVTASSVIEDYIDAIGGKSKLSAVKTLQNKAGMSIMGQEAEVTEIYKAPNKYYMNINVGGMLMQEQIFDGMKASTGQMGQNQVSTEGPEFEKAKEAAVMFSQLNYNDGSYSLDLKGIEEVEGKQAYKIEVTNPRGEKSFEFYDMSSSLLVRNMTSQEGPQGQMMTMTADISDYRDVSGIMIPYTVTLTGVMPTALVKTSNDIKINTDVSDETFMIK